MLFSHWNAVAVGAAAEIVTPLPAVVTVLTGGCVVKIGVSPLKFPSVSVTAEPVVLANRKPNSLKVVAPFGVAVPPL